MKHKILIIDDDADILEALNIFFKEVNFDVYICEDGEKVIGETIRVSPDVILLDLLLSGSDGGEITKALKSEDKTKDTPIIIISAHPKAKERALSCGADDFLAKPFDLEELLGRVQKLLDKRKRAHSAVNI